MSEVSAALLALGQQVLQRQEPGEQPGVCFAAIPLIIPAAVIVAYRITRGMKRLAARSA
ncbi:MAG: hypothetical protein IT306_00970 [Chloroflexi bacterium]|nr:hypothetical protein [Chloroflexota bacterium]